MIGSTLAKTLTLLKAELGANLTLGVADDARYYQLLELDQEWFASMYDWNQLCDKWDVDVQGGLAGRYNNIPTVDYNGNTYAINFSRPVQVYVRFSLKWQEILYGIGPAEYNIRNSELNPQATQDPIMKWKFQPGDRSKFEIWPLGASQTQWLRFEGQRQVNSLRNALGEIDPTKTLDLDDRLIALNVAIGVLSAKEDPATSTKVEKMKALWQTLRSSESKQGRSFPLGGGERHQNRRVVPITVGG